jgi:hypothetical protein
LTTRDTLYRERREPVTELTVESAAEHLGIAPGDDFVVEGLRGEEPGVRYRLIRYTEMSESGAERLRAMGVPVSVLVTAEAREVELVKLNGLTTEFGHKFRAFPAEFIRVPGRREAGPAVCERCGDAGTKERKVRFSRKDGKRLHPDCRSEES